MVYTRCVVYFILSNWVVGCCFFQCHVLIIISIYPNNTINASIRQNNSFCSLVLCIDKFCGFIDIIIDIKNVYTLVLKHCESHYCTIYLILLLQIVLMLLFDKCDHN